MGFRPYTEVKTFVRDAQMAFRTFFWPGPSENAKPFFVNAFLLANLKVIIYLPNPGITLFPVSQEQQFPLYPSRSLTIKHELKLGVLRMGTAGL